MYHLVTFPDFFCADAVDFSEESAKFGDRLKPQSQCYLRIGNVLLDEELSCQLYPSQSDVLLGVHTAFKLHKVFKETYGTARFLGQHANARQAEESYAVAHQPLVNDVVDFTFVIVQGVVAGDELSMIEPRGIVEQTVDFTRQDSGGKAVGAPL